MKRGRRREKSVTLQGPNRELKLTPENKPAPTRELSNYSNQGRKRFQKYTLQRNSQVYVVVVLRIWWRWRKGLLRCLRQQFAEGELFNAQLDMYKTDWITIYINLLSTNSMNSRS